MRLLTEKTTMPPEGPVEAVAIRTDDEGADGDGQPAVSRASAANLPKPANTAPYELPAARIKVRVEMPLPNGTTPLLSVFDGLVDGITDHFALTFKSDGKDAPLVRMHSSCMTGDILGSERCDCGPQLKDAIGHLSVEGGHLLYLHQEGRGIGLANQMLAYALQDSGIDTFEANRLVGFPADMRDYRVAAQMLRALNTRKVRLVTNNPEKVKQLEQWGIQVTSTQPTIVSQNRHNHRYLTAKRDLAGHSLQLAPLLGDPSTPPGCK